MHFSRLAVLLVAVAMIACGSGTSDGSGNLGSGSGGGGSGGSGSGSSGGASSSGGSGGGSSSSGSSGAGSSGGSGGSTSSSSGGSSSGGNPDAGVSDQSVSLTMGPFTVPGGSEVFKCQTFANPFGGKDVDIKEYEEHMTEGSHHMFAFFSSGATDGALEDCPNGGLEYHPYPFSAQSPDATLTYPPTVGSHIPGSMGFMLNAHFVNATASAFQATLTMTFHLALPGAVTQYAGVVFMNNVGITIPPGQTPVTVTRTVNMPQDMNVIESSSHMHQRATDFVATSGSQQLCDAVVVQPDGRVLQPAAAAHERLARDVELHVRERHRADADVRRVGGDQRHVHLHDAVLPGQRSDEPDHHVQRALTQCAAPSALAARCESRLLARGFRGHARPVWDRSTAYVESRARGLQSIARRRNERHEHMAVQGLLKGGHDPTCLDPSRITLSLLLAACGGGADGGFGETTGASEGSDIKSCASGQTVEGIDVSKWDGTINWKSVKSSGKAFAFIRVSDGVNSPDGTFATNWKNAKAAGVYRGVYQYFEASQDPTAQAKLLLNALGSDLGELPAVIDVEVTDGMSASTIRSRVDTWSSVVAKGTGRTPIVYVSPGFWPSVGGSKESDNLWVANWGTSCPTLPSAWSSWVFWQYSDTGSVSGISGQVDLNRFNGSLADLATFANGGGVGGGSSSGGGGGSTSSSSSGGSGSSSGTCGGQVPAGSIARSDVIANAEQWVAAKLQYCQSANGEPDADPSCSSTCERTSNPEWDPYRSDCSGFVSWAWQLSAPGLVTDEFAPFSTSASSTIQCTDLTGG